MPFAPPQDPSFDPMKLTREEYKRYGRQMILPGWGLPGQLALKAARVAVVGAGGLGCPVLQYLAGAGVGTIDVYDHDEVSVSNLHRQVLHTAQGAREGWGKAESAARALRALNPHIGINPYSSPILPHTALKQLASAQIIVDCTDRPLTRYLLSDAAVRLGLPLVSGAAISDLGQWAVYGGLQPAPSVNSTSDIAGPSRASGSGSSTSGPPVSDPRARACYRCIWPRPLPGSSGRCEDVGVWGMVTGMVGTGMATEVVKLIIGKADPQPMLQTLHLSSAPMIRSTRLRPPRAACPSCGPCPSIGISLDTETGEQVADLSGVDYVAFCAGAGGDGDDWRDYTPDVDEQGQQGRKGKEGEEGEGRGDKMTRSGMIQRGGRMSVRELQRLLDGRERRSQLGGQEAGANGSTSGAGAESNVAATSALDSVGIRSRAEVRLVDTRSETEFGICAIPGSVNIPLAKILKDPISALTLTPHPSTTLSTPTPTSTPAIAPSSSASSHLTDISSADTASTDPASIAGIDTVFICKLGNDSQIAAEALRAALLARAGPSTASDFAVGPGEVDMAAGGMTLGRVGRAMDVRGGLRAWGRDVDPDFPLYF